MGLSLATLLAQHNNVVAVDVVQEKVDLINNKKSPDAIYTKIKKQERQEQVEEATATTDISNLEDEAERRRNYNS